MNSERNSTARIDDRAHDTSIEDGLKAFAVEFDRHFERYLDPTGDVPSELAEAICYSALAPGKRIRPYLVVRCCELVGGCATDAWPVAAAVECVHAFSLVKAERHASLARAGDNEEAY